MKKYKFIALSVLLLCFAGSNIYGQRKEISKEEFFDAYKKTSKKAATYRIIGKTETYRNNKLKSVINETREFVLPDKRRFVSETKMFQLNQTFVFETVLIGRDEYKRENNGDWIKRISNAPVKMTNSNNGLVEDNEKFYLTENAKLDNQTANLYELTVEYKHTRQNASNETKEIFSYLKDKRWISRDGFLLKMELEDELAGLPGNWSRRTWTYEYDPNIKIESPVLENKAKL